MCACVYVWICVRVYVYVYVCVCVRGQVGDPVRAGETRVGSQPEGGTSQVRPNMCLLFCLFF